ncbi:MAG: long-chain fatty acid--CoA ligase [Rhodocyclaceae bacterium]
MTVPNLARLLLRSARAHPRLPALASGSGVVCDYAGLASRVERLAGALVRRLGLVPGGRVALVMKNSPAYVELLFACWHAGLTAVPINAKLHPKELEFIFEDTGARVCFASAGLIEGVAQAGADLGQLIDPASAQYAALFDEAPLPVAECSERDLAWLFYTSGTTGRPKGVMLTHRNLLAMTLNYFSDVDRIDAGDAIVHAAPMSHGSGLYLLPHVAAAAVSVIPESRGFDADEVLRLMGAWRGVTMFAAPTMVKRLAAQAAQAGAPGGLKTLVYGGGPMYLEDLKRAMEVFGYRLAQIYGQGESPMTITALSKALHADTTHPRYEARIASVGLPDTGVEVRIGDERDQALPPGAIGEVLVRGDSVMAGYLNDPEASAQSLRGGWLHTGDLGVLDEEGFLTLKDRSKDVIISGGSNIYPREVEEVLLAHPAVLEVAVLGSPDPEWGERVTAFVVVREGVRVSEAELDALCLARIARFKRPKDYRFVAALPKNETGKVLKTVLRRL